SLSETDAVATQQSVDLLALGEAMEKLAALDQRQAEVIDMRFFGGLTNDEIAEALGVSVKTVEREWKVAKAWLRSQLE
ncbi:MAG TPA: sigma-70 family RNA polymerase sigma factor, partial [Blastocatellia bacterium]